jgi:cytochrome P450 family 135
VSASLANVPAADCAASAEASLPPGPRLPRALQAALRTWRYAEFRERCCSRYGDTFTVRIGGLPTSVLTRDREAIGRLFTGDPLQKRHGNDLLRPFMGERSVLVLEPEAHLERRKLLLPAFHGERVESYARLIEQLAAARLDEVRAGELVSIQKIAQALTLEVILSAVLGISDPALREHLSRTYDSLARPRNVFVLLVPILGRRSRWNLASRSAWRLKDELDALLLAHIAATRADPGLSERDHVLAMMVLARDEHGAGLSDEELRDDLTTLITAGHETTATAIAWGVELLAHNPAVLADARPDDDAYMEALVKEVLRMYPPVPVGGAREVLAPFQIGRWTIPPRVPILVDAYGVHHDPVIYPEPDVFQPKRFLEAQPERYTFLPFGGGAHRCLGATLATLEAKVVLREILRRVELSASSKQPAHAVARGPTIAPRGGARVRVVAKRL